MVDRCGYAFITRMFLLPFPGGLLACYWVFALRYTDTSISKFDKLAPRSLACNCKAYQFFARFGGSWQYFTQNIYLLLKAGQVFGCYLTLHFVFTHILVSTLTSHPIVLLCPSEWDRVLLIN